MQQNIERYVINGGKQLNGTVKISGSKNAALPIIAASIMSNNVTLENIPNVSDINILLKTLTTLGINVDRINDNKCIVNTENIKEYKITYKQIKQIRASYYLLGALLGRYQKAIVPLPGGCEIGNRPIDLHIKGFKQLGADIKIKNGNIIASAKELTGTKIFLDFPSVGATINIMMAAVFAKGKTIISNAAKEPHVVDVAVFLSKMGARIEGAGSDNIYITGVKELKPVTYSIVPDQIEAGTFMALAAATNSTIKLENVIPEHLNCFCKKFEEMGCKIIHDKTTLTIKGTNKLLPVKINTMPYPGFPTDMQPQMAVVAGLANGNSVVIENMFNNRYKYIDELIRMGFNCSVHKDVLSIEGIEQYSPTEVTAPDLRAGAALVIAALNANGESTIYDIKYILRGYENFDGKLRLLGADIKKI